MGVYIKGMDMPKDGEQLCININPDGKVCINLDLSCEKVGTAVSVLPHGRLIDADAYEELIRGLGNREYRRENGTICDAIKFLHPHYAPTIIEAEEAPAKDINAPTQPYDLL